MVAMQSMTPCSCGCACCGGAEAPKEEQEELELEAPKEEQEELELEAPLLDIETGTLLPEHAAAADGEAEAQADVMAEVIGWCIIQVLLFLLWLYLVNLMRRALISTSGSELQGFNIFFGVIQAFTLGSVFFTLGMSTFPMLDPETARKIRS